MVMITKCLHKPSTALPLITWFMWLYKDYQQWLYTPQEWHIFYSCEARTLFALFMEEVLYSRPFLDLFSSIKTAMDFRVLPFIFLPGRGTTAEWLALGRRPQWHQHLWWHLKPAIILEAWPFIKDQGSSLSSPGLYNWSNYPIQGSEHRCI